MKIIGLDIGTTTFSGALIDIESGGQLKTATIPNTAAITPRQPWQSEQDPDAVCEAMLQMVGSFLADYPDVSGIGICGQMHGILYTDSEGKAASSLFTWQDARAAQSFENGEMYCGRLSSLTGYKMAAGYGLGTHYYNALNALAPENVVSFCTIADYVAMRLCGNVKPLLHASNAASMGLFDLESGTFDTGAVERAGLDPGMLPPVLRGESIIGETITGIPVASPLGDNQASFLGSVDERNSLLLNIGTGSQISFLSDTLLSAEKLEFRPYVGGRFIAIGAGLCGGYAYELLKNFFASLLSEFSCEARDIFPVMNALAQSVSGEANRLKVDTRFCGERGRPDIRGGVGNIGTDNFTPGHLALGFLQGICDELHEYYALAPEALKSGERVVGSGNAIRKNPALRSVLEAAFQKELLVPSHREEAATGAALLAARLIGGEKESEALRRFIRYEPASRTID